MNRLDIYGLYDVAWGDYADDDNGDSFTGLKQKNLNAILIFLKHFFDMRKANWKKSDKCFHCKAKCEVTGELGKSYVIKRWLLLCIIF